jgi:hypothetical protein
VCRFEIIFIVEPVLLFLVYERHSCSLLAFTKMLTICAIFVHFFLTTPAFPVWISGWLECYACSVPVLYATCVVLLTVTEVGLVDLVYAGARRHTFFSPVFEFKFNLIRILFLIPISFGIVQAMQYVNLTRSSADGTAGCTVVEQGTSELYCTEIYSYRCSSSRGV